MKGRNYKLTSGMPRTRKEFLPGAPNPKIARFTTGKASGDYDVRLQLISENRAQIRHNALEAARVAANKKLAGLGEDAYFLAVRVYPHIILCENRMIATAGADRLQEGMRKAFGKPVGLGARVNDGTVLLEVTVKSSAVSTARDALKTAASKLPVTCTIIEAQLKEAISEVKS